MIRGINVRGFSLFPGWESRHVDYPLAHGSSNQAMSVSEGYVTWQRGTGRKLGWLFSLPVKLQFWEDQKERPTNWPKMGTKRFWCDAGRMRAGNQNLARQMCVRMLELCSTGLENQGKRVGSSKSQMYCFLDKRNFLAVSDNSFLGGSCFVTVNVKSCLAASQQHSYLIYQWKFWRNGGSLLESRSAIQQAVFLLATENPRKIWGIL